MQTVCASKGSYEFSSALTGISQAEEHFPRGAALSGWSPGPAAPHTRGPGSVEDPQALRRDGGLWGKQSWSWLHPTSQSKGTGDGQRRRDLRQERWRGGGNGPGQRNKAIRTGLRRLRAGGHRRWFSCHLVPVLLPWLPVGLPVLWDHQLPRVDCLLRAGTLRLPSGTPDQSLNTTATLTTKSNIPQRRTTALWGSPIWP